MEKKEKVTLTTSEQILEKSAKGATFLMMGQFFTKLVTFFLNSLLVRFLSPRIFGIIAFLEFILGTILFFSREAIRLSTLRIKENTSDSSISVSNEKTIVLQTAVNFAHIPIWIGIPLSIVLITWQYTNVNAYFISLPHFQLSIFLIWISIIIELLSEPFFVVNQFMLNYGLRSRFEGIAVTMGCVINFTVVYAFEKKWYSLDTDDLEVSKEGIAILAFSLGKLAHSITLLLCYSYHYMREFAPKNMFKLRLTKISIPGSKQQSYYFQTDILEHFKKVYFQMCFKHLLTEGDKLIINSLCTVEEQGIYSLLSNYGSLVTRMVFAPIEEALRLFLARLLSNTRNSKNLRLSMEVLVNLTRFYLYLSLLIIIFGPVNSSFLLQFIIGLKWSTVTVMDTIRVYCFYLPFLSINGIFEAFFQSVASGDQILRFSYLMMFFSGVFLLNCWIFIEYLDLSVSGLIISNIINMSLRISYCGWFIHKFYKELYNESSFLINFQNLIAVMFTGLCISGLNWWFIGYVKTFKQLFLNIAFASALLILILYKERNAIKQFLSKEKTTESKQV
ncbi:hypothetical protein Kpol_1007p3 [Vanderwaltozyma polyspora DSM 70294]|uniref:Man(5)GlcNAc(2)-PP-dolichol translocation protein RFT1 n=1 Tax=Vanderwaltozyma polyspora (strain ATCC 22028 / DSM 70294 / BCRC 21397 / CBS 2163 / NBRC 10782 / NRRL Y-8283 / UCD 57-17) TaxID=436907 RepID=A7TRS5_VANPO|nr:uncharacterized protein Kpol_1007p3 [Vanderwaltozyma polyspora DSM 70294]EDO15019.1 hypothetical protein Kpol_1007p3 [Vanderwaltozyma polyspora DSM 70294]